jgi:hypothetical protein
VVSWQLAAGSNIAISKTKTSDSDLVDLDGFGLRLNNTSCEGPRVEDWQ